MAAPHGGRIAGPRQKSKLVYALDLARDGIRTTKTAVVMEGYTDVIAAHQAGYTNVVATLGTALAETHVGLLRRFAEKVVLVYDGDEAGLKAACTPYPLQLSADDQPGSSYVSASSTR
jgi:DNA primase